MLELACVGNDGFLMVYFSHSAIKVKKKKKKSRGSFVSLLISIKTAKLPTFLFKTAF